MVHSQRLRRTPAQVREFWTPEKVKQATRLPLPKYTPSITPETAFSIPRRVRARRRSEVSPSASPAVSGIQIPSSGTYPYSTIGKLLATFPDGRPVYGTGLIISESFVLTAAHCIYNPANNAELYDNIAFVPGAPQETQIYVASEAWLPSPRMNTVDPSVDYGVVNLFEPAYTGPYATMFFGLRLNMFTTAFGYADNVNLYGSPGTMLVPDGYNYAVFSGAQNTEGGGGGPWLQSSMSPPPFVAPQDVAIGLTSCALAGNGDAVAGPEFSAELYNFLIAIGWKD